MESMNPIRPAPGASSLPSLASSPHAASFPPISDVAGEVELRDLREVHARRIVETGEAIADAARDLEASAQDLLANAYDQYAATLKFMKVVMPSNLQQEPAIKMFLKLPVIKYGLDTILLKTVELSSDALTYKFKWKIVLEAEVTQKKILKEYKDSLSILQEAGGDPKKIDEIKTKIEYLEKWGKELDALKADLTATWSKIKKGALIFALATPLPLALSAALQYNLIESLIEYSGSICQFLGLGGQIYNLYTRYQSIQKNTEKYVIYQNESLSFPERQRIGKAVMAFEFLVSNTQDWEQVKSQLKSLGIEEKKYENFSDKESFMAKVRADSELQKIIIEPFMKATSRPEARAEAVLDRISKQDNLETVRQQLRELKIKLPESINSIEAFKHNLEDPEYRENLVRLIKTDLDDFSAEQALNLILATTGNDSLEAVRQLKQYRIEIKNPSTFLQDLERAEFKQSIIDLIKVDSNQYQVTGAQVAKELLNKRSAEARERENRMTTDPDYEEKLNTFGTELEKNRKASYDKKIEEFKALIWALNSPESPEKEKMQKELMQRYQVLKDNLLEQDILKVLKGKTMDPLEAMNLKGEDVEIVPFKTWFQKPTKSELAKMYSDEQLALQKYAKDLTQLKSIKINKEGLFVKFKMLLSEIKMSTSLFSFGLGIAAALVFFGAISVASLGVVPIVFSMFTIVTSFILLGIGLYLHYKKHPVTSLDPLGRLEMKWKEFQVQKKKYTLALEAQHVHNLVEPEKIAAFKEKKEKTLEEIRKLEVRIGQLKEKEWLDFEKMISLRIVTEKEESLRAAKGEKVSTFHTLQAVTETFDKLDLTLLDDETGQFLRDELGINIRDSQNKLVSPKEMRSKFISFFGGDLVDFMQAQKGKSANEETNPVQEIVGGIAAYGPGANAQQDDLADNAYGT